MSTEVMMAGQKSRIGKRQLQQLKKRRKARSPSGLREPLAEADWLMEQADWSQAADILTRLDQKHPRHPKILHRLVEVYAQLGDEHSLRTVCRQLDELQGPDPDRLLLLGNTHLRNAHVFTACECFRRFISRWPRHQRVGQVQKTLAELEVHATRLLKDFGLEGDDAPELAVMHEEIQHWLHEGDVHRVRETVDRLLDRKPDFVPALNNLSMAEFLAGNLDEAIRVSRRALEVWSDNCHALANLARYLYLNGQADEAMQWVGKLKLLDTKQPDRWVKAAETLVVLGDDQGVLETFAEFQRSGQFVDPPAAALLHHFAAFASLRSGDEPRARQLWNEALRRDTQLDVARENLDDLNKSVQQQNGPWPLRLQEIIARPLLEDLIAAVRRGAQSDGDDARDAVRGLLEARPELETAIPLMFDRGAPDSCEFAVMVASLARTPRLLEHLRTFAHGRHGADQLRSKALHVLRDEGLLESPAHVWMQGQWRDILLEEWEIHADEDDPHSPEVLRLKEQAVAAWARGDGETAESLFRQALELEPGAPDLLNNLAAALQIQNRREESHQLIRRVHEDHPDYFFGCTNLAKLLAREGEHEKAKELLDKVRKQKRLHVAEFDSFCAAQVELAVCEGKPDAAQSWLDVWMTSYPDSRELKVWQRRLARQENRHSPSR